MPNTNVYNRLAIRKQGARGLSMVARDRSHSAVNFSAPVSVGTAGIDKAQVTARGKHVKRCPVGHKAHHLRDYKGDTSQPRRLIESNFFLTINPNQTYHTNPDRQANTIKVLEAVIEDLAATNSLKQYIVIGPTGKNNNPRMAEPAERCANDKWEEVIEDGGIRFDGNVEVGPNKNRVHAHILLEIRHYSFLQVDIGRLQRLVRLLWNSRIVGHGSTDAELEVNNWPKKITKLPYTNVKLMPQSNWTEVIKAYIHKAHSGIV